MLVNEGQEFEVNGYTFMITNQCLWAVEESDNFMIRNIPWTPDEIDEDYEVDITGQDIDSARAWREYMNEVDEG